MPILNIHWVYHIANGKFRFWAVGLWFSSETRQSENGFRCIPFCLLMYSLTYMHMHGEWSSVHSVGLDLPEYVSQRKDLRPLVVCVLHMHEVEVCT